MAVVRGFDAVSGWRGLGQFVRVSLEGILCPGNHLPVYMLGNQQPTTTSRRGAGQPRRNGVVQFLQPLMWPVFGRDMSFEKFWVQVMHSYTELVYLG